MIFNFLRNFDIFNNALSCVITESSWIQIDSNCKYSSFYNFSRLQSIYLSHSLNFSELDIVTFLIWMSFIFMQCYICLLSFFYHSYNEWFSCFSIMVCNNVIVSIVKECIAPWTESLGRNVANILFSAKLVNRFRVQVFSSQYQFSLAKNMNSFLDCI